MLSGFTIAVTLKILLTNIILVRSRPLFEIFDVFHNDIKTQEMDGAFC